MLGDRLQTIDGLHYVRECDFFLNRRLHAMPFYCGFGYMDAIEETILELGVNRTITPVLVATGQQQKNNQQHSSGVNHGINSFGVQQG
jgi:hypothetical protein